MTAPSLFDPVRPSDPPSSHLAARANKAEREAQTRAILVALAHAGRDGLSNDQLDAMHSWRAGTASRRTAELIGKGQVRRLTETRATRTGSPAHVLVLARAAA